MEQDRVTSGISEEEVEVVEVMRPSSSQALRFPLSDLLERKARGLDRKLETRAVKEVDREVVLGQSGWDGLP